MTLGNNIINKIDKIRNYLHGGGYPDPLANAEQLSIFFFFIMYETLDDNLISRDKNYKSIFLGKSKLKNKNNSIDNQDNIKNENFKWSIWSRSLSGNQLVFFVRDEVFPFYNKTTSSLKYNFLEGSKLIFIDAVILKQVLSLLNDLDLNNLDIDTKGDLFEYILKQIRQAGELGQFRTPRHIIETIIEIIHPKIGEKIYDPAVGTAGFLISAFNHIKKINSSKNGTREVDIDGTKYIRGIGDKLSKKNFELLEKETFFGNDVDIRMTKLSMMNLFLRNLQNINILNENALTTSFNKEFKIEKKLPLNGFDVVLANPPFSGKIDKARIVNEVKIGTSKSTELLFIKHIINSLNNNGRVGMVVPEGILFGRNKSFTYLRKNIIDDFYINAIISLPRGVFNPYSGVKTSILILTKGKPHSHILFIDVQNDGYKMNSQHNFPIKENDLPIVIEIYNNKQKYFNLWKKNYKKNTKWEGNYFFVALDEIKKNDYLLNLNRHKPYFIKRDKNYNAKKEKIIKLSEKLLNLSKGFKKI